MNGSQKQKQYRVEYAPKTTFYGENPQPFATWGEAKNLARQIEDVITPIQLDIVTLEDGKETRRDSLL